VRLPRLDLDHGELARHLLHRFRGCAQLGDQTQPHRDGRGDEGEHTVVNGVMGLRRWDARDISTPVRW